MISQFMLRAQSYLYGSLSYNILSYNNIMIIPFFSVLCHCLLQCCKILNKYYENYMVVAKGRGGGWGKWVKVIKGTNCWVE